MDSEPAAQRPTLPLEDERRLVQLAQKGDREAWMELVRFHQRTVYRIAFALTRSPDDAAQVTRDALIRGWQQVQQIPEAQRVLPWLLRIVRGLAIALNRRRAGKPEASAVLVDLVTASSHDAATATTLLQAFVGLNPDDQIALSCRLLVDLPYSEIEAAIQTPPGVAMRRLSLARVELEGGEDEKGESVA